MRFTGISAFSNLLLLQNYIQLLYSSYTPLFCMAHSYTIPHVGLSYGWSTTMLLLYTIHLRLIYDSCTADLRLKGTKSVPTPLLAFLQLWCFPANCGKFPTKCAVFCWFRSKTKWSHCFLTVFRWFTMVFATDRFLKRGLSTQFWMGERVQQKNARDSKRTFRTFKIE